MTQDEFLEQSYEFRTNDKAEAEREAARYNALGVDGHTIIAVSFCGMWCVMLKSAFGYLQEIGIEGGT